MQPESQVMVREFNRRLRAALGSVPNHVRVEAALEVESHVQDVLAQRRGTAPEPELVAQILAGFGTPEAYAAALISQRPGVEAATVQSGAREVIMAAGDLVRGSARLVWALARQGGAHLLSAWRRLWPLAVQAAAAVRGPVSQAVARLRAAAPVVRARWDRAWRLAGTWASGAGWGLRTGWRLGEAALRSGVRIGGRTFHGLVRLVGWILRAAAVTALAGVAAGAFLLAGFAALAPDIVGWWMHTVKTEITLALNELRAHTVAHAAATTHAGFVQTGLQVAEVAALVGLALTIGLCAWGWAARRRRSGAAHEPA